MKTSKTFLASLLLLLSVSLVSAQYGNSGYGNNGYGNNGHGNNGSMSQMNSGMGQRVQSEKPKEIPADVTVANVMEEMTTAVNLDELQVIAISNVLIESLNSQGRILKQESNQEEQIKNIKAITEITDSKINDFLSKEQKEKYIIFKEDRSNPKKTKSKEKKEKEKKKIK